MLFVLIVWLGFFAPAFAYDLHDNAPLHSQRAITYMDLNRYPEAIEEFKIAIQLNPGSALSASLYNNLGLAYLKTGQSPLALASFQHAIRIQPGFELYYQNLVKAYQQANRLDEARDIFQQLVAYNPQDGEAWFLLGLMEKTLGNGANANVAFKTFLTLEPYGQLAEAAKKHL